MQCEPFGVQAQPRKAASCDAGVGETGRELGGDGGGYNQCTVEPTLALPEKSQTNVFALLTHVNHGFPMPEPMCRRKPNSMCQRRGIPVLKLGFYPRFHSRFGKKRQ
jgi:hypothetical protein